MKMTTTTTVLMIMMIMMYGNINESSIRIISNNRPDIKLVCDFELVPILFRTYAKHIQLSFTRRNQGNRKNILKETRLKTIRRLTKWAWRAAGFIQIEET